MVEREPIPFFVPAPVSFSSFFFIASSFLLQFLVIGPPKNKRKCFFFLNRKLGCSVIIGEGAKGETEAETVNIASDSQPKG